MLEGIEGVSTFADDINKAFYIVNGITLFLFVVTIGTMLYFVYKYRAKNNPPEKTQNIEHYTPIEIAWTVIPAILLAIVFYYGVDSLKVQRTMPSDENSIVIKVLGQRWSWNFEYPNGKKSPELIIPVNQNIKLKLTAPINDVIHSFYVPAFRVKQDVLPGEITELWFNIEKEGKYDVECAEYCGTRHSFMRADVKVVSMDEYNNWLNPKTTDTSIPVGLELINQNGCKSCHSFDGSVIVGPSLKDIFNKKVIVTTDAKKRELIRDEVYLKDAILNANKDIVEGFSSGLMPDFNGVIKEEDVNEIIEYLKNQANKKSIDTKPEPKESKEPEEPKKPKKPDAQTLLKTNGCFSCHSVDGSRVVGPSFKGIYNKKEKVTIDGKLQEITVDEQYIKDSITKPKKAIVESYPSIMPAFGNLLSDEEIEAILEYLKTIK